MDSGGKEGRLIRSTAAVAVPTLISRILGYFRDLFLAFFLGTGHDADAFTIAFIIPNLFRRLTGEGALSASFIPAYVEIDRQGDKKRLARFAGAFFADSAVFLAVLTGLGIVFAPALVSAIAPGFRETAGKWESTVAMTRIMFPYLFFVSLAALASALLNARGRFFLPAAHPVAFNLVLIAGAIFWAGRSTQPALVFAAAVLAGGILQLAVLIPWLIKKGGGLRLQPSFRDPDVRRTAGLLVPGFLGVGVYQINLAVSRMLASGLEPGSTSALYYSSRVEELTMGLFSIALSVVLLPQFSASAADRDLGGMRRTLEFSLKLTALVTVPAAFGLAVLSRPIIRVLFERGQFGGGSTEMSASCLLFFAAGLPFVSGVKILTPAFFSLKDTFSPVKAGIFVVAINIGLAIVLARSMRVGGLAAALSASQVVNFIILLVWVQKKIGWLAAKNSLLFTGKAVLAAAIMAAAVNAFYAGLIRKAGTFLYQAAVLFGTIAVGLIVYAVLISLLNPGGIRKIIGEIRAGREEP